MGNDEKIELFERTPIANAVMKMAVPTVISSLVMVLYSLADTYFVGMLNDPIQNAAVTLASPILLAFNAVNNLFGVGSSSMMSRALGVKDYNTVRKTSAFGFYCALLCSLLLSLFYTMFRGSILTGLGAQSDTVEATAAYLFWTTSLGAAPSILNVVMGQMVRAEGAALHASIGTMSGCIMNMILDPIFIMPWGLNMGAAGAGCATFISNCFACLYFFVLLYVKRKNTYVSVNPKNIGLQKNIILGVFAVGIPAAIQNLLNVTGMTILNNYASSYGSDAVAAIGIAQKINMVPFQIALGGSQGVMPLISYNYASGNIPRMKKALTFISKIMLSFLTVVMVGFFVGSNGLIRLFMSNDMVVAYGSRLLKGFCIALPFIAMDFIAIGVFQACGMGKRALVFAILRKIVLEIPAIIIWNKLVPFYGLSYAQPTAEIVLAVAAVISLAQIFRELEKGDGRTKKAAY
jgi:putative MATE family efflux protein